MNKELRFRFIAEIRFMYETLQTKKHEIGKY
jgi:hypothetical protein